MAYREPLTSTATLAMFLPDRVLARVEQALQEGKTVEMENTSLSDPGPDECRVLIDGERVWTIPGY